MDEEEFQMDGSDLSPEKKKKLEDLSQRSMGIMAEATSIVVDDETKQKIVDKTKNRFIKMGIPYDYTHVKAFLEGMDLTLKNATDNEDRLHTFKIMFILREDNDKKKPPSVDIDITKSKKLDK